MDPALYSVFPKDRAVVVSDGTPIAYTVLGPSGEQTPFAFANGWSCSDVYWGGIAPVLAGAGHPCVVPDMRGHGESGLPRPAGRGARNLRVEDMSLERMATDFFEVLDDAGIDRAVFVGHSMGVQTILEAYRLAPDRVAGLVAVAGAYETPLRTFYGTSLAHHLFPVGIGILSVAPELLLPLWSTIGNAPFGHWAARRLRAAGPNTTAAGFAPYLLHLRSRDPLVMFRAIQSMRDHSAADVLPDIDVPTLILAAGRDTFTPPVCQKCMHDLTPRSEIVWFPDGHHTLPMEEPEAIASAMLEFVARRVETPAPA